MKNLKIETVNNTLKNQRRVLSSCDLMSTYNFANGKVDGEEVIKHSDFYYFMNEMFHLVPKSVCDFILSLDLKIEEEESGGGAFRVYPDGRIRVSRAYKDSLFFADRRKFDENWEAFKNLPNIVKISIENHVTEQEEPEKISIENHVTEQEEPEKITYVNSADFEGIHHNGKYYDKESIFIIQRKKTGNGNHLIRFTNLQHEYSRNFTAYFTTKMQLLEIADSSEFAWAVREWKSKLKNGLPRKACYMAKGEIKTKTRKSE